MIARLAWRSIWRNRRRTLITVLSIGFGLAIAIFFLLRRIFSADIRLLSTFSDYFLLVITALPFMTGYFLTHGTLDGIGFFADNIQTMHMVSGEIMLILIPFTKLSHFILFFFARGATGVEFGRRGYSV